MPVLANSKRAFSRISATEWLGICSSRLDATHEFQKQVFEIDRLYKRAILCFQTLRELREKKKKDTRSFVFYKIENSLFCRHMTECWNRSIHMIVLIKMTRVRWPSNQWTTSFIAECGFHFFKLFVSIIAIYSSLTLFVIDVKCNSYFYYPNLNHFKNSVVIYIFFFISESFFILSLIYYFIIIAPTILRTAYKILAK